MKKSIINLFCLNKSRKTYKIKEKILRIQTKPTRNKNPNRNNSKIMQEKRVKWKKLPFHRLITPNLVPKRQMWKNRKEIYSNPILYLEQKIKVQFLSLMKSSLWSLRNKWRLSLTLTNMFPMARQKIQKQWHMIWSLMAAKNKTKDVLEERNNKVIYL